MFFLNSRRLSGRSGLIVALYFALMPACKSQDFFGQKEKANAQPASAQRSSDPAADGGVSKNNDRPSESNPGVPGYFLFCSETSPADAYEKDFQCGVSDSSKNPVRPYASDWTLGLGTLAAQIKIIKNMVATAGPILVQFHLSISPGLDLAVLPSQLSFAANVRLTESSPAGSLLGTLPEVLAVKPVIENLDLLGPNFPFQASCAANSGFFSDPTQCELEFPDASVNRGSGQCTVNSDIFSCANCNKFNGGFCCIASSCVLLFK